MTTRNDSIEVPYGWRMVDGRIVADEIEQAIIVRVRALRATGLTIRAIVAGLAMEGVRTRSAADHLHDNGVKLGGAACGVSPLGDRTITDDIANEARLILARFALAPPHVPYGWRLVDGCLVADEAERAVLAQVRALRDAGLYQHEIVAELRLAGLISEDSQ